MHVNVVIVAAGTGKRMQNDVPKPYLTVCGKPVLLHTLERFWPVNEIERIIVVVSREYKARCAKILRDHNPSNYVPVSIVIGGSERQDSVRNGLNALDSNCEIVVIHDAARPLITTEAIENGIRVAAQNGGAIVAEPASDTIKRINTDSTISETVPREDLWLAQTPQTFQVTLIKAAHAWASEHGIRGTDDSSLVEKMGRPVSVIRSQALNLKITTPSDLRIAECLLKNGESEI